VNIGILNNPKLYNYHYDQLNRLTGMDVLNGTNTGLNLWTNNLTATNDYQERASYDPNGNILTYTRNGYGGTQGMDNLTYHYNSNTNQLNHIGDAVASGNYPNDLDDQDEDNYKYDAAGNLIRDSAAGITSDMTWSVYGKLLTIPSKSISYQYDAAGNRIGKTVGSTSTWYVRDAQGNILATYSGENMALQEQEMYGSSRLGMISNAGTLSNTAQYLDHLGSGTLFTFTRGKKLFELTNHLGNVLATVSDKKFGTPTTGIPSQISYYSADVKSAQDYYPFGMEMPGRQFNSSGYSYGFNGQMKSDEVAGVGNHNTAMFWEYDPRIGRRWNVDPKSNVWESAYLCFSGNPIYFSDIKGDSAIVPTLTSRSDKDYKPWMPLLKRNLQNNLLGMANKRFYIQSFKDQRTSEATGEDLNLDLYTMDITKLPAKFSNSAELFDYIRANFNQFINGPASDFESYDKGEGKLWGSSNPSSAILRFKGKLFGFNIDDADVITTNYVRTDDYASWTFRPVGNLNILNPIYGGDKGHPLAGNREFGIQKQGGGFLFYIQGVDRLWSAQDELAVGRVNSNYFFKLADRLWRQVMNNIANRINSMGGRATFDSKGIISKRIDYYQDVRDTDKDKIRNSGN
jgi:hypothetical protein